MEYDKLKDRIQGALMGAIIGDALGVGPHWYYDLAELRAEFGEWIEDYTAPRPGRYREGLEAGQWSQTGQVYVMLMQSVAERGAYLENDFTSRVDELLKTLDGTPHGGRYTDEAMRDVWMDRMELGKAWEQSGSFADTAEAAMRAVVPAARYAKDFKAAASHMLDSVLVTHVDPVAAGRSLAYGMHVWALINGASLADSGGAIQRASALAGIPMGLSVGDILACEGFEDGEASFIDAILQPSWIHDAALDPGVQIEPAHAVCRLYGLNCPLDSLFPAACYLTSRFEYDFEFAVLHAVNGGGNNMARAALTGGLAGAMCGLSAIPERFISGIEDSMELLEAAEKIAEDALSGAD